MLNCRILPAVVLGLLLFATDARAQSSATAESANLPGGHYRGQYIGFKPRYGQVHQPPRRPTRPVGTSSRTAAPSAVGGGAATEGVTPSVFADGVPADEFLDDEAMALEAPVELLGNDGSCCAVDPVCQVDPAIWARGDYLLWWTKGMAVPPLATTSPPGTLQEDAGVLGSLNTTVLFGGGDLLDKSRSGGRIILGMWLDPCHQNGLEISYLGLDQEEATFRGNSDQFSILARPFENVVDGMQDARLIDFPDLIDGELTINTFTKFQTGEVLLRRPGIPIRCSGIDFFVGYRYAELEDGVHIAESTASLAEPTTGTTFQLNDRFETSNEFHGGQVGVRFFGYTAPRWALEFTGKFALGNTNSRTTISGQTVVTTPDGGSSTQPAGLLAQGTNSGVFETNEISTITEVGLTLRRQLACDWSFTCGYNFLLWTDVLRAGEQIDTSINVSQIPPGTLTGEPVPAFLAATNDFWAQGLSFGLEYHY